MRAIADLFTPEESVQVSLPGEYAVQGVSASTRTLMPGEIFFAVKGTARDGHEFVEEAYRKGASLCVVEREEVLRGRPGIVVSDAREALSRVSARFFGSPTHSVPVVGITGTNGKTTTNWMVYQLLRSFGFRPLRVGTLGWFAEDVVDAPESLTTPDPVELHSRFRTAVDAGVDAIVMEVSSHALDQRRVADVRFSVGVFTNLTRDHLDYHGTMDHYFGAKSILFQMLARPTDPGVAVLHEDDPYGARLVSLCRSIGVPCITFGVEEGTGVRISRFSQGLHGARYTLSCMGETVEVPSPFIGMHNAQNLAAAVASLVALGVPFRECATKIGNIPQVPGRLESVGMGRIGVYVDYAHTPDALRNVLTALRPVVEGKLWVVFGCGGDRDRGKRPQMADVATRYADCVVVTSDNPRTEDPHAIIRDILSEGVSPTLVEVDRRRAIRAALDAATEGDVVLIAGKGHEPYQIVGAVKHHFSDVEEVQEYWRVKV